MVARSARLKLDSPGPVLFRQPRHGFNNNIFHVLKFRSMHTTLCQATGTVVQAKRTLDRAFFCAAPLFEDNVQEAYRAFIDKCFVTYGGWGMDARLKTGFSARKEVVPDWQDSWETLFAPGEDGSVGFPPPNVQAIIASYDALIAAFAGNIELSNPRDRYVLAWRTTDA